MSWWWLLLFIPGGIAAGIIFTIKVLCSPEFIISIFDSLTGKKQK